MKQSVSPPPEGECPFCRERIPRGVAKCYHCGSVLDSTQELSMFSVLLVNFLSPGLGSWRMGEKVRGGVIIVAMALCILMTGINYASTVSRQLDAAIDTQDDAGFEASFSSSGTWWVTLSTLVFIYSFVDIYLIYAVRKRNKGADLPGKK